MNQISPFEYVSMLVSIILGLGITQILSSVADMLYHHKRVRLYWPHSLWVIFIFFLHIQDWFITYQLRTVPSWDIPSVVFVLAYPVLLFTCSKMLLPTNEREEQFDMKVFYQGQFKVIFTLIAATAILSILFNVYMLGRSWAEQALPGILCLVLIGFASGYLHKEYMHKLLAIVVLLAAAISLIIEKDSWVIR